MMTFLRKWAYRLFIVTGLVILSPIMGLIMMLCCLLAAGGVLTGQLECPGDRVIPDQGDRCAG